MHYSSGFYGKSKRSIRTEEYGGLDGGYADLLRFLPRQDCTNPYAPQYQRATGDALP